MLISNRNHQQGTAQYTILMFCWST